MEAATTRLNPMAIRATRQRAGVSQEKLAQLVGVTTGSIRSMETGSNEPRASTVARVAAVLGIDMNDLFGEVA
ncbi:MAG: helix-turn-helix transcriptional regulator [Actinobacteria bacterium]|nr:helix-turn-helix transcriptional regulator [Actinomycetota bacterium]